MIERAVSERLPVRLMQADIDGVRTRDEIKRSVISVLQELGFLPSSPERTRLWSKPRLVKSDRDDDL